MSDTAFASIGDLALRHGGVLRDARLAYVARGTLAPDGRNAVLLTHGYTSSHQFADGGAAAEGSWSLLIGPGRPIDTDRFFVVSSNMLGSSFGSTGPASLDPATGRPYGPDFPRLTLADIVAAQRRLLEGLGVRQLAAVVGPSYGGFQAFAWGVEHPDFVRAIAPITTAPRVAGAIDLAPTRARLAADPAWNGGRYAAGALVDTMTALREDTLRRYGIDAALAAYLPDPATRPEALRAIARRWAEVFDPHALFVLGDAANEFDATPELARLRARVLFVLSTTDALFPPAIAPPVMAALHAAGVEATYEELDSPYGHMAPGLDAAKWAPALARLMASVA
ncbi:MAG TPA: alpha/beta fold hydrolase [Kofleriaceae bacterium]|jgi:homoserine O-acetyltransferase|nr:alpha/beta fold hydrolase [Kofleriaceae bacterium]